MPAIEATLTIAPPPRGSMSCAAAWQQMNVPVRLTSSVRRQTSSGNSSKRSGVTDAGVVDEEVEPAERLCGLAERRVHARLVGDVARDAERPAAHLGGGLLGALLVEHGDGRARGLERPRDRPADALRGSGDDARPPLELPAHAGVGWKRVRTAVSEPSP